MLVLSTLVYVLMPFELILISLAVAAANLQRGSFLGCLLPQPPRQARQCLGDGLLEHGDADHRHPW